MAGQKLVRPYEEEKRGYKDDYNLRLYSSKINKVNHLFSRKKDSIFDGSFGRAAGTAKGNQEGSIRR